MIKMGSTYEIDNRFNTDNIKVLHVVIATW